MRDERIACTSCSDGTLKPSALRRIVTVLGAALFALGVLGLIVSACFAYDALHPKPLPDLGTLPRHVSGIDIGTLKQALMTAGIPEDTARRVTTFEPIPERMLFSKAQNVLIDTTRAKIRELDVEGAANAVPRLEQTLIPAIAMRQAGIVAAISVAAALFGWLVVALACRVKCAACGAASSAR